MSDIAIQVGGLSKRYRIGARQERYKTLRDSMSAALKAPIRRLRGTGSKREPETIWALTDVSFDVERGEVVGVIGRNGAGKSTLLKILSRITEPTRGFARIHGRVGSLLEVGTGFHPELTGRENIFLNGAILGMRRSEIDLKFDEIVSFAEVEQFIDSPVKHYSSGMYLRLAFAVAAHMEPEILIVDEVLAVGDAAFQKKCIGKMGDIANQGRTVFFVSHNLGAIKQLCTSSLVLRNGALEFQGKVTDGLACYGRSLAASEEEVSGSVLGWQSVQINGAEIGTSVDVGIGAPLTIHARLDTREEYRSGHVVLMMSDAVGNQLVHRRIDLRTLSGGALPAGSHLVTVQLPPLRLAPGVYTVYFKSVCDLENGTRQRLFSDRVMCVVPGSVEGLSNAVLAPECDWELRPANIETATTLREV